MLQKMIDSHWQYVQSVLLAHGTDLKDIELCEHHYKSAFEHGYKHGIEEKPYTKMPVNFAEIQHQQRKDGAFHALNAELTRAQGKHPHFPEDIIHAVAIMCEESGEAIRAALQYKYEGGKKEEVRKELIHTGAMVLRCLINLDGMK